MRLACYSIGKGWQENQVKKLRDQAEHLDTKYKVVEKLLDIRQMRGEIYIQVRWLGLPGSEDFTWQKLDILNEDIPDVLKEYLNNCKKKKIAAEAREFISDNSLESRFVWGRYRKFPVRP